jgi:hypothetical protein
MISFMDSTAKKHTCKEIICIIISAYIFVFNASTQDYTRGTGIYPGNPGENFSPSMSIDDTSFRNLALHRPAWHSSSIDYNLTAQLVTDGIIDSVVPQRVLTYTSEHGLLKKNEREWIIDRHNMTAVTMSSSACWIKLELAGGKNIPGVDSINISGILRIDDHDAKGYLCIISGSDDGKQWNELGRIDSNGFPGRTLPEPYRSWMPADLRVFNYPFKLQTATGYRQYKLELDAPNVKSWDIGEFGLFINNDRVKIGGPYNFTSAWMSEGTGQEWVYVDLGAECAFDSIVLHWISRASAGSVQVSDDALAWEDLQELKAGDGLTETIVTDTAVNARYIRVLMQEDATGEGYILSELKVFGYGGPVPVPCPSPLMTDQGRLNLAGGAWRVQRESLVEEDGEVLSQSGYNDDEWIVATVPGTVLSSYLNAGALPDPNFGDNQQMISESFFYDNFWYRTEFTGPEAFEGSYIYLNFDGINWKADVYLNGSFMGPIEGAFTRGCFDVTGILIPGQKNVLAVRIEKNATPGFATEQTAASPDRNGGELGADNPTFHASVGWDWIPTIRGRNTGIWNDVYLTASGSVTMEDPFVSSDLPLPDTSSADITIEVTLHNRQPENVKGVLHISFGNMTLEHPVKLKPLQTERIILDPSIYANLRLQSPELWWPNGYGKQSLYFVELKFVTEDNLISDIKSFFTGIRELTYSEEGGILKIWINGRRLIGRGGNWGFPESMLRYRGREYNIAMRYHQDMNFTMIRNWVGQTGDDEFYEACDRHGIMIWQDFWLANPVDGPDPADNDMFLNNAEDMVRRIRNHPSIALYCGRNEGYPPMALDTSLRQIITGQHPGLRYISNSAWDAVSGGGPYRAMPVKFYFEKRATTKLHSEMGMPNIVNYESLAMMMPDSTQWPQGRMWGLHDFCIGGAQRGSSFIERMEESFGTVDNLPDWLTLAQWINYDGYRAMFEAQGKNRMGLLLWMSHPAWPSLVWQTYDYYFEPTAAYFGCKKGSEPLHIQWNAFSDSIEVVNYSVPGRKLMTAAAELINIDGTSIWQKSVTVSCPEDSMVRCFAIDYPSGLTKVYFLRLRLLGENDILSENFYWRGADEGNVSALRELPLINLESVTQSEQDGALWHLTTELINSSAYPALMVRLKVVGEKSHDRILPVIYSDNYVSLMPGEKRIVHMEVENADTRGEKPAVVFEGMNIAEHKQE